MLLVIKQKANISVQISSVDVSSMGKASELNTREIVRVHRIYLTTHGNFQLQYVPVPGIYTCT